MRATGLDSASGCLMPSMFLDCVGAPILSGCEINFFISALNIFLGISICPRKKDFYHVSYDL
jgi:hypothetical protein